MARLRFPPTARVTAVAARVTAVVARVTTVAARATAVVTRATAVVTRATAVAARATAVGTRICNDATCYGQHFSLALDWQYLLKVRVAARRLRSSVVAECP